jgi:hypothetical protein
MSKRRSKLTTFALAAALLGVACSDAGQPLAPVQSRGGSAASEQLLGGIIGGVINTLTSLLVPPLNRTTPLANDVVWSFTAGPGGAVSSNASVGLKIVVPSGALSTTQTITVTALAGAPVAYKFEPHLEFSRKVYLTQNLSGTTAGLLSAYSGAHFATDRLELTPEGLAVVTEIVPSLTSLLTRTTTFGVTHFSGWIVAGRSADGE